MEAAYPARNPLKQAGCPMPVTGSAQALFIFFSNRLGCGGSLLVSAIVTVILLLVLGVIELG
jgi:hypothetical protein